MKIKTVFIMLIIAVPACVPQMRAYAAGAGGYPLAASYGGLSLYADSLTGSFVLEGGGARWHSSPQDAGSRGDVRGVMKNRLLSLVTGTTLDMALGKETAFYSNMLAENGKAVYSPLKNGFEISFEAAPGLSFALRAELGDGFLSLTIPDESIAETDGTVFKEISLAPGLGTGGESDSGFMLIPDGCGAVINFNNGRKGLYSEPVYGGDKAFVREAMTLSKADIALPVYGVERNGRAMLAVLHSGAERARISAAPAGNGSPYNSVYPSYTIRAEDTQAITVGAEQTLYEEPRLAAGDIELRLYPLAGEDGGYTAMARALGGYLQAEKGMSAQTPGGADTLLTVYGGVSRRAKVLGVPLWNEAAAVTAFGDTRDMITDFLGVTDGSSLVAELKGWDENQILGLAKAKAKPPGALGGANGLDGLSEFCAGAGVRLYAGVNAAAFSRGNLSQNAVRNIGQELSAQFEYYMSSYAADHSTASYLLKPERAAEYQRGRQGSVSGFGFFGTSFADAGSLIYGDYDRKSPVPPAETAGTFAGMLAEAGELGGVMVNGGFMYALGAADIITDAPSSSSGFSVADAEIPFYQIALSGLAYYASPAVNLSADRRDAALFALETGSLLHWEAVGADDMTQLRGTALGGLYGAGYSLNKEYMAAATKEFAPLIRAVSGRRITAHAEIAPGVRRTVFENGAAVTVNYTWAEHGGVPAKGYVIE